MKHRLNVFLVLVLLVFFAASAQAQESNMLVCPLYTQQDLLKTKTENFFLIPPDGSQPTNEFNIKQIVQKNLNNCSGRILEKTERIFEKTMNNLFLIERQRLQAIQRQIYADNQSSPQNLSQLLTQSLRESAVCQQLLCETILTHCNGNRGPRISEAINRFNKCEYAKQVFFSFALDESQAILAANADKKKLGLVREKLRFWEKAFNKIKINELIRVLQVIESKLSNLQQTLL